MSLLSNLFRLSLNKLTRGRLSILILLLFILCIAGTVFLTISLLFSKEEKIRSETITYRISIRDSIPEEAIKDHLNFKCSCRFHTCFEINNCSIGINDKINVYVYPEFEFTVDATKEKIASVMSVEYQELIAAVKSSRYYQPNASKACVFVSSVDTLSQDRVNIEVVSKMLHALPK